MKQLPFLFFIACNGSGGDDTGELQVDLTGMAYVLDLSNAAVEGSADLQGVVTLVMSGQAILIGVDAVNDTTLDLRVAPSVSDQETPSQDICAASMALPSASRSGNTFQLSAAEFTWQAYENAYVYQELAIGGTVAPGGDTLSDISLSADYDLRQSLVTFGYEDIADLCDLAGTLGINCEPCEDGTTACVNFAISSVTATAFDGTVEAINTAYSHPDCSESPGD